MKRISFLFLLFRVFVINAQINQAPEIPDFHLLLMDSTTQFSCAQLKPNTNTILIHFSPDCDHCQKEISLLLKNYDKFKNCQFIVASASNFSRVKDFVKRNNIAAYPKITAAWEPDWIFSTIFKIRNIPFVAIFDKNQQFLKRYEGESSIEDWMKVMSAAK